MLEQTENVQALLTNLNVNTFISKMRVDLAAEVAKCIHFPNCNTCHSYRWWVRQWAKHWRWQAEGRLRRQRNLWGWWTNFSTASMWIITPLGVSRRRYSNNLTVWQLTFVWRLRQFSQSYLYDCNCHHFTVAEEWLPRISGRLSVKQRQGFSKVEKKLPETLIGLKMTG